MKKLTIVIIVSLMLGGCVGGVSESGSESKKLEDTVLQGRLIYQNGKAVLQQGAKTTELDSYSVDFSSLDGVQVEVSGQYSGDTLFVDEVSEL